MFCLTNITTGYRSKLLIHEYKKWLKTGEKVLDAGCGDGLMSSILKDKLKINVTGCDIENYLKTNIHFILMRDQISLPFKNKSFECVMFNDVLHHMSYENQLALLHEALRVSNKVLLFEVEPTIMGIFADYIINKFHHLSMNVPLTFRSSGEWIKLFKHLNIRYTHMKINKPVLYPFTHQAFLLQKD